MSSKSFASDYFVTREAFRQAAGNAGSVLFDLPLNKYGPNGEKLTIDIAWLGSKQPSHVLLHLSGVHGVEGFVGSAIQCRVLSNPPPLPDDHALMFVHTVNPWGMAWIRRFNENNVDLNRNFIAEGEQYAGAPAGYAKLDPLLNPKHVPRALDLFLVRCVFSILRYGFANLKETIACGQYDYPQGLFFGGKQLEASSRLLSDWLREHLTCAERIAAIDIHSGLGKFGEAVLFVSGNHGLTEYSILKENYGEAVQPLSKEGVACSISGMFMEGLTHLFETRML